MLISRYLSSLIVIYIILIFVRVLTTWFGGTLSNRLQDLLEPIVDPYLRLISRVIPPFGAIDFSPTIGVILLLVIQNIVLQLKF
jgi:YggT family protein